LNHGKASLLKDLSSNTFASKKEQIMNNVVYRPITPFSGLHQDLSRILNERFTPFSEATARDATDWVPRVDIREEESSFIVDADLPGVDAKAIDITLEKNILTIRGSRSGEAETDEGGYKRKERFTGSFVRQFTLPETADGDTITAKTINGVLRVTIPKTVKSQARSIEVQNGG
jgi:HSP20 family protein